MSKQAIALLSQHPDLAERVERLQDLRKRTHKKFEDLRAQGEEIAEKADEERESIWSEINGILAEKNLTPEGYDEDAWDLCYDDSGALYAYKKSEEKASCGSLDGLIDALKNAKSCDVEVRL